MSDLTKREEREKLRKSKGWRMTEVGVEVVSIVEALDACDTLEQQRDEARQYAQEVLQGFTGLAKQRDAALDALARLVETDGGDGYVKAREVLRAARKLK